MPSLKYWQKNSKEKPLFQDLLWNIPDQVSGRITIIGGNSQSFSTPIRVAEYITSTFPVQGTTVFLPDSLAKALPPMTNLEFMPSTKSGSFAPSKKFEEATTTSDTTILIGDFSKNTETSLAVSNLIAKGTTPIFLTRDTIDLVLPHAEQIMDREQLFLLTSIAQLQKLFRAIYYPKMIVFSMPLLQLIEILHKFTLSYTCTIITLHEQQIIVAANGKVTTTPIADTSYTPLSIWNGTLISNIAMLNLYTPGQPLEASTTAILYTPKQKSRS